MFAVDGDAIVGQHVTLKETLFEVAQAFLLRENVQARVRIARRCHGHERFVQMPVRVPDRARARVNRGRVFHEGFDGWHGRELSEDAEVLVVVEWKVDAVVEKDLTR